MRFSRRNILLSIVLLAMGGAGVSLVWRAPSETSSPAASNTVPVPKSKPAASNTVPVPESEQKKIVQELNSLIWGLTQVKYYNDVKAVQDAKRWLKSDNLNFGVIKDETILNTINRISEFITEVEIDAGDREIAEATFEHEASQCMWDAFSGVSAGSAMNPASALLNLATSAAGGYMQYRKALADKRMEYRKAKWELDKKQLEQVNELEIDLNRSISDLTKRYNFRDDWRIGSNDAVELSNILKWPNKEAAWHELCMEKNEEKFMYLPQYWLQRGLLEFALYKESRAADMLQRAHDSIYRYIGEYENINRNSDDLVLAASAMIAIKGEQAAGGTASAEEIKKMIALIEKHSDRSRLEETWKNDYAVYAAYRLMGEPEVATQKLRELIVRLEQNARLHNPIVLAGKDGGEVEYVKFKEPLNVCVTELNSLLDCQEMDAAQFVELFDSQYIAAQKKLALFGKLNDDELKSRISKELNGVELVLDDAWCEWFTDDKLVLKLPVSWVAYNDPVFTLRGKLADGTSVRMLCSKRGKWGENVAYEEKENCVYLTFALKSWNDFYEKGQLEIHLYYPSIDHPVGLIFKKSTQKQPSEVRFGKAEGYTADAPVYLKEVTLD